MEKKINGIDQKNNLIVLFDCCLTNKCIICLLQGDFTKAD